MSTLCCSCGVETPIQPCRGCAEDHPSIGRELHLQGLRESRDPVPPPGYSCSHRYEFAEKPGIFGAVVIWDSYPSILGEGRWMKVDGPEPDAHYNDHLECWVKRVE